MPTTPEGKHLAQGGSGKVSADYGQRAAYALDRCVPGPHRDKKVAGIFGVSVRMAKYLRQGHFWTTDRLTQASRALQNFDAYIASPNIHQRLDALEAEIVALRQQIRVEGDE